jgi:hypothetical protein
LSKDTKHLLFLFFDIFLGGGGGVAKRAGLRTQSFCEQKA